ncbi:MAG TPA: M20/M25/M40 family metallo-hydrolase [Candidatus Acidoferrales bacterium]|nr:M20/M25/M40 family metallo-hydrolase [Candidatus Acidoferrales bacterium]
MKPKVLSILGSVTLTAAFGMISAHAASDPTSPAEDGTLGALSAVAGAAMMESHTYQYLEEVSDDIGARVTGSPEAAKAIAWGVQKMKSIGLENVHTESFQLFRGWKRISAEAEIVSPIRRRVMIDSLGWVGSTPPGGVEAQVIPVNLYRIDEELANSSEWRGKVLLTISRGTNAPGRFDRAIKFLTFIRAAQAAGAAAVIGGQSGVKAAGMHMTHTGVIGYDAAFDVPVVSMAPEDQDQIARFLDAGKTVRMKINVQNQFTSGPVESANVVGEVRGLQYPEQIIVVGGHLDSWDLASGATDNGCGTATTLGAAEAVVKSGKKPRRTIRFVLFTGEEQGLDGSRAYTKEHAAEMKNHVADVILDTGQGPVVRLQLGGHNDLVPAVQEFAKALEAFGTISVDDEPEFGTDTGPFILAGLPGINLNQDSPDYLYTHHSAVDTFDKVDAAVLDRNAAVMALTAFWIADRPERLAAPWPAAKTAQMLVDKRLDGFLQAFGLWPFGNPGSAEQQN